MKLSLIILFLFTLNDVFGQSIDSALAVFATDRKEWFVKEHNVPSWMIDGIRAKILSNGDTVVRASGGVFRAEEVKVYADGTNQASAIQAAFDFDFLNFLYIAPDSSRMYTSAGSLNIHGKQISFLNGGGMLGTSTIDSLTFEASPYDYIFDTSLNFTNLKSVTGVITPYNFGAPKDGISNANRYIRKCIEVGAANKITVLINGKYYNSGDLVLYTNTNILMPNTGILNIQAGSNINYGSQRADSVVWTGGANGRGGTINLLGDGSGIGVGTLFSLTSSNTADTCYYAKLDNITIRLKRNGYHAIMPTRIKHVYMTRLIIDSSNNSAIFFEDCQFIVADGNELTANGRAAICVYKRNKDWKITNNTIKGFAQYSLFTDGAIDSYGPGNENGIISGNYIYTDTASKDGANQQNLIRVAGCKNVEVYNNFLYCQSMHLDHAMRFSLRDTTRSDNINVHHNYIFVQKNTLINNLIFFQGVNGINFNNNKILLGDTLVYGVAPSIFGIFDDGGSPSREIDYANFRGNTIDFNNNAIRLFVNSTNISEVDMSFQEIENGAGQIFSSTNDTINNFTWLGGKVKTTYAFPLFTVPENTKIFSVSGLYATSTSNVFLAKPAGSMSLIISNNNTLNGIRDNSTWGGGGYLTPTFINSTSDSLSDWTGSVEFTNTTANQTFDLSDPSHPINIGRTISAGRYVTSAFYTIITGLYPTNDTILTDQGRMYYCDGVRWTKRAATQ